LDKHGVAIIYRRLYTTQAHGFRLLLFIKAETCCFEWQNLGCAIEAETFTNSVIKGKANRFARGAQTEKQVVQLSLSQNVLMGPRK